MFHKNLFIFLFLLFGTNTIIANDSQRHQEINGMSIYLGVIPAQLTQKYGNMHGGANHEEHSYHIVIAIFNSNTGERITNAKLKATVASLGMKGKTKDLEPMRGSLLSYGNYFTMREAAYYNINVEIQRANKEAMSVAKFIYNRPKD